MKVQLKFLLLNEQMPVLMRHLNSRTKTLEFLFISQFHEFHDRHCSYKYYPIHSPRHDPIKYHHRKVMYKEVMKQRKNIKNVSFYHFMCIIHSNCSTLSYTRNHIFIAECLSVCCIRRISLDYRSITFILPIPFFLTFYIKTFRKNAFLLKYSRIIILCKV